MVREKLIAGLGIALGLSACNGSGDGPNTVFTYQPIDSTVSGDSTVRAVGVAQEAGNSIVVKNMQGTLTRENQALEIAGLIVDTDGSSRGVWSDGTTTVAASGAPAFSGVYDYVLPVEVTSGGLTNTYLIGVATRHQDLPSSGSATFTGQSIVNGILTGGGTGSSSFEASGDLSLTADFAAGVVDVVMENLAGTGAPIDEIAIGGLSIVNGGGDAIFAADSQSTIQFESGGTVVTPIGDPTSFDATGAFFGGDESGPLEAGGAFQVDGTGGGIFGIFVADDRK